MKKSFIVCFLICLLGTVLLLTGCVVEIDSTTPEEEPVETPETEPVEEPAETPEVEPDPSPDPPPSSAGADDVAALLAKCREYDQLYYEYVLTHSDSAGEVVLETKIWMKGNRFKAITSTPVEAITYIIDTDKNEYYLYFEGADQALLTPFDPEVLEDAEIPENFYDDVDPALVKIVGTEVYGGYRCKVMVITNDQGEETKMWVSEEYGLPLRVEYILEDSTSIIEFKNIKVGPGAVSDDDLELPPGVEIMDMRLPE